MAAFMTSYSTLSHLQSGDLPNAMLLQRASAEANLLEASKFGDWRLWWHDRDAMQRWFSDFAQLRAKLPTSTRGPVDEDLDRKG